MGRGRERAEKGRERWGREEERIGERDGERNVESERGMGFGMQMEGEKEECIKIE